MLQTIRDRATGWIAYTIIILICIPFALWGVNSYFTDGTSADVAEVGGRAISQQEYQTAYQQERARLQNLLGANARSELLDGPQLKGDVLQRLVDELVLEQTTEQQGMRVGDEGLNKAIREISAFQEDGRFSAERYRAMLNIQGYTPSGFEENFRNVLANEQLRTGVVESALLSDAEIEQLIALLKQKRDIALASVKSDVYKDQIEVDEAAIKTFYEENQNRFTSPERVKLQYLELDLDKLAADVEVSEEDVRREYEAQQDLYRREEERRASHILVSLPQDADPQAQEAARERATALHAAISSGEKTFDQVLEEAQTDPAIEGGDLGLISKDIMESAFENALFTLAETGAVSEPIKTSFGYHIVRLDEIIPGDIKEFEDVREQIETAYRFNQAEATFFDAAETMANLAFEHPGSLEPAAQALDLPIQETDFFTRDASEGIARFPQVRNAAFSPEVLQQGVNSAPLEVEPSHMLVVRLLEHDPAEPLSLEDAREQVEAELRTQRAAEKVEEIAQALKTRVEQGEDLAALAEEYDAEYQAPGPIGRNEADKAPSAVLTAAFAMAKPGEGKTNASVVDLGQGDKAVVALKAVLPGSKDDLAEGELEGIIERIENERGRSQFESFLQSRRQQTDIVTFADRL